MLSLNFFSPQRLLNPKSLQISDAATREGAKLLEHWFIGCPATYVVCEDASIKRYVGHSDNIVTVSNATCYPCICFEVLITRGDSFVLTHYPSNLSATLDLENSEGKKLATSCPFVFGPSQACCHGSAKRPDI